jgi:uncharacterized membrane protein
MSLERFSWILMSAIYLAAGSNHFWHPRAYLKIMPPYLPAPLALVYLSGAAEMGLGLCSGCRRRALSRPGV